MFFFFLVVLISLLPPFGLSAQAFDFNQAYDEYVDIYGQYREADSEYQKAKAAYQNYQTSISKKEAIIEAGQMFKTRDLVIKSYLNALRRKLAETTGVSNYKLNVLYLKLDEEVYWFQNQAQKYPGLEELEALSGATGEARGEYQNSEKLIFQALGAILTGKENILHSEISQQIEKVKEKLEEIRTQGDKDISLAENWILEAENRLTQSQEKIASANQAIAQVQSRENEHQLYNQAKDYLKESHQSLDASLIFLKRALYVIIHD